MIQFRNPSTGLIETFKGLKGNDGKSAYEYATSMGYPGSEEDFAKLMSYDAKEAIEKLLQDMAGIANIEEVTQAEYDALGNEKLSNDVIYCIKDADPSNEGEEEENSSTIELPLLIYKTGTNIAEALENCYTDMPNHTQRSVWLSSTSDKNQYGTIYRMESGIGMAILSNQGETSIIQYTRDSDGSWRNLEFHPTDINADSMSTLQEIGEYLEVHPLNILWGSIGWLENTNLATILRIPTSICSANYVTVRITRIGTYLYLAVAFSSLSAECCDCYIYKNNNGYYKTTWSKKA